MEDDTEFSDDESVLTELTNEINEDAERSKLQAQQQLARIKYQQLSGHKGAVTTCTYTAKCTRVLTSSYDTTCKLWDVQTNKTLRTYRGHTRNVSKLSVSDDGKNFFSSGWDKRVLHWDTETGDITWEGQHDSIVTTCAYSHGGQLCASTSDFDSTIRLWDTRTGKTVHVVTGMHSSSITSLRFCRNDDRLLTSSNDRSIKFYDLRSQVVTLVLKGHQNVVSNAIMTAEERIVASVSWDKTAKLWDVATGQYRTVGPTTFGGCHDGSVSCCDFNSNETLLLTGGYDRMVIVWDVESVAKRFRIAAHEDWVMDAQFSDDDKSILTCSRDGSVRIWNIERTDELPVVFEERRSIGLRLVKCKNCGRSYSVPQAEMDPRNMSLCVFCRLAESERALNLHSK